MNAYLYGHKGAWLLVDLGVTFGDPASTPGVDLLTPDITLLESLGRKLKGLVVTHAHEDHFGAIPYLADALDCPLYATPLRPIYCGANSTRPSGPSRSPASDCPGRTLSGSRV